MIEAPTAYMLPEPRARATLAGAGKGTPTGENPKRAMQTEAGGRPFDPAAQPAAAPIPVPAE